MNSTPSFLKTQRSRPMAGGLASAATRAIAIASALLLAGCGGGQDSSMMSTGSSSSSSTTRLDAGTANFLGQMAQADNSSTPVRALASASDVNAKAVLDWAEYKFPDLFKGALATFDAIEYDGKIFYARIYNSAAGPRYLGVATDGRVFGLGDFTNFQLQQFDTVAIWTPQILADWSNFQPGEGSSTPPGPLNSCTMSASSFLVAGNRFRATYIELRNGAQVGTYVTEQVVEGPATFEGQSVMRSASTFSGTNVDTGSTPINITSKTYDQARSDGFIASVGVESSTAFSGVSSTSKVVFNPPSINGEFGLVAGQTYVKSVTTTASTSIPGLPASSATVTTRTSWTFEGMETITVRGKTYNTCRYRSSDTATPSVPASKHWFVVDRGVPARSESTTPAANGGTVTTVTELDSATINGSPI